MQLEINNKHKKANLSKINKRNKVFTSLMALALSINLYSGISIINNKEETQSDDNISYEDIIKNDTELNNLISSLVYDNNIVNVPNKFIEPLSNIINSNKGYLTNEDLENIKSLNISSQSVQDKQELLWLNYCKNLSKLTIKTKDDSKLEYISILPNLSEVYLYNYGDVNQTLEINNTKFLHSPNLKYLKIENFNIEKGLLESLTQLETLDISSTYDEYLVNYNFDFSKMTNLKKLIINNVYSLVLHLDNKEIKYLIDKGIQIVDENGNDKSNELININTQIDEIVSSLPLKKNSDDLEKIDEIIAYTINRLNYDETIEQQSKAGKVDIEYARSFYDNGYLHGALDSSNAICGNYSALISVLCDRLNLKSHLQISPAHAWNLVIIDDNPYMVDSTLIDTNTKGFTLNDFEEGKMYLKTATTENDYMHTAVNLSELLTIEELESPITINTNSNDITNKIYKLSIHEKTYIVSSAALIGILMGFGYSIKINKKNQEYEIVNQDEKTMNI